MAQPRILAFVLAGGEGRRLRPLTSDRAKPAVEVARGVRIVDFVLANLVNSGVRSIYLLAHYKPGSLMEHVARVWRPSLVKRGCRLEPVIPEQPYRGTAHAVYCNLDVLARHEPDMVAVFAADHVYRMDVRQMAVFHEARAADVTVAAMPVPLGEAGRFGVIRAADFGHHLLPHALERGARVFAYDFSKNHVPGVRSYEDAAYWRDVGTVEALEAARRDLEGRQPRLDLANADWPLHPA